MRSWFFPLALSVSLGAQATPPQRVEILYEVSRNGTVVAEVTERLEHDGHRYTLQESWKGRGLLAMRGEAQRSSRGAVAPDGLRPAEYRDVRGGRERRRANFDPGNSVATLEQQDRLSVVWSFSFAPPAGAIAVRVADGNDVTTYHYQSAGRERLVSRAGEFETLRLVRQREGGAGRSEEIWLATDRQHLPVRMRTTDRDGARIDKLAVRITLP